MKAWDKIIIVLLLVISFIPYVIFSAFKLGDYDTTHARITINGQLYKEIPLTAQIKQTKFEIKNEYGTNEIVIENEGITIINADCPDGICTQTGFIKKPGQSITCLPHKLHIEIKGSSNEEVLDAY